MPSIVDYANYSEIAFASYGSLLNRGFGSNAPAYVRAGMSNSQATVFDKQWSVLAQADIGDGFSAVLFERVDSAGRPTGEKVLGIRGTETSYRGIDFQTDIVDIALLGTNLGMSQFNSLEAFYQQLVTNGKLGANETFTVSGHSLGGFLTQAFAAKHTNVVQAAYTYNAPGFSVSPGWVSNISTELLEFFGITNTNIPNEKIFNVRSVDGPSATAGLGQMIGSIQPITIEQSALPTDNHSIVPLTDSLAVQALLNPLDPNASIGSISAMMKAASSRHDNTLEILSDALRRLVSGPSTSATATDDRNALYANLKTLTDRNAFRSLVGRVSIGSSSSGLAAEARNDFASMLALIGLSPVALRARAGNESQVAKTSAVLKKELQCAA